MMPVMPSLIWLAAGVAAGALAVFATLRPRIAAAKSESLALHARLAEAEAAQSQLGELREDARALRHDLRGILSPALLCADRLANNQDPAIRKSADIVIRSVERATVRLAAKTAAQDDDSQSDQE